MASEELCSTEQASEFLCSDEILSSACNSDSDISIATSTHANIDDNRHKTFKEPSGNLHVSSSTIDCLLRTDIEAICDSQNAEEFVKYQPVDLTNLLIAKGETSIESDCCESSLSCQDCSVFINKDTAALEVSTKKDNKSEFLDIDNRSNLETIEVLNSSYNSDEKTFGVCINDDLKRCLQDANANTTTFHSSQTTESTENKNSNNTENASKNVGDCLPSNCEDSGRLEMDSLDATVDCIYERIGSPNSTSSEQTESEIFENTTIGFDDHCARKETENTLFASSSSEDCIASISETNTNIEELPVHRPTTTNIDQNNLCIDDLNAFELLKLEQCVLKHNEEFQRVSIPNIEVKDFDSAKKNISNSVKMKTCRYDISEVPQHDVRKYSLHFNSTVPSIAEEEYYEECSSEGKNVEFDDILRSASPTLRRSRCKNNNQSRQDCRLMFNEPCSTSLLQDETKYKSLRDSLEISRQHLSGYSSEEAISTSPEDDDDLGNANTETKDSKTNESKYLSSSFTKSIPYKKKKVSLSTYKSRRVSFPDDDASLITSYLEPVNPWYQMSGVTTDDIAEAYRRSCYRHSTRAIPLVLQQIIALPVQVGGRIERLSLRQQKLDSLQVECLEEIFRRVQFKTLDFEQCFLEDDTAIPLFDMIEFYDSACHLNISGNNKIGNRGWQACARMLKRTPSLKLLDARETNLNEQNMPILCRALRIGTRLHTLHLENCNLTGRPLINLSGALRMNDTITDLYLGDNRLGSNDCIHLGNLVRSNKTLKLLDLRNNNIQDAGCAHICKDITEQQVSLKELFKLSVVTGTCSDEVGLVTLNLWNNYLTINCIPHLSNMLSASVTLQTLNLGKNYLTSEGILLLKNALTRNRTLIRLGLQATRLGNEGAVALAECVVDNLVISRIDLRENSIQVAGLMALSRSLAMTSNIIQLDIDCNPRAEPTSDLSNQHLLIQQEIKALCQKNQVEVHSRTERDKQEIIDYSFEYDPRKISLTCETLSAPITVPTSDRKDCNLSGTESKRYWSPAPSPSISPCPSPSLSPSPSPVPSPLKNRFKVFKVSDDILSNSAPATLSHSMSGSLPSLSNRFLTGKRFTVTKVNDSVTPLRAMSSPSLIAAVEGPSKSIRGFDLEVNSMREKDRNNSLELPSKPIIESPASDDVFEPELFPGKICIERKHAVFHSPCLDTLIDRSSSLPKAPLAAMEAGSFDSDSDDSELTTQSSDSTRSDEIKISSTDQMAPIVAWETKKQDSKMYSMEPLKAEDDISSSLE